MSKKETESKEIARVEDNQFEIMKMQQGEIADILHENLGEDSLSIQDLTRVVVPGSGGKNWAVETVEGDKEMAELLGIIVFTKVTRTYWEKSFDETGGGEPPNCYSPDGVMGVGEIADTVKDHMCGNCRMSEFAKDGSGCPCKESRQLFMVMKDEILPIVIKTPVMSLKNAKKYLTGLSSRRQKTHSVYTALTLFPTTNKKNIKYSQIVFTKAGDVENPALSQAYAQSLRPFLEKQAVRMAQEKSVPEYGDKDTVDV